MLLSSQCRILRKYVAPAPLKMKFVVHSPLVRLGYLNKQYVACTRAHKNGRLE